MNHKSTEDQILKEYEEKANDIIFKMYKLLEQTQRKVEDKAYRKILDKTK